VPGTLAYMAPECLVGKKKGNNPIRCVVTRFHASRAFNGKGCWGELLDSKSPSAAQEVDSIAIVNTLIDVMKSESVPGLLKSLSSTVHASLEQILKDCFLYESNQRPRAIDLVHAFHS